MIPLASVTEEQVGSAMHTCRLAGTPYMISQYASKGIGGTGCSRVQKQKLIQCTKIALWGGIEPKSSAARSIGPPFGSG